MGQLKALLPWEGTTLLQHQVGALSVGGCTDIVVVLGHRHEELSPLLEGLPKVRWVHNPDYLLGKTTSLKTGLRTIAGSGWEFFLVLNVDQPRSVGIVTQVIEHQSTGSHLITIPCHKGKGGHPVAIDSALLPELADVTEESEGMKAVVKRHAAQTHRIELGNPELLLDLNTPEDYQRALALTDTEATQTSTT